MAEKKVIDDIKDIKVSDVKEVKETSTEAKSDAKPVLDAQGRAYATGKRKDAVARVWIKPGKGEIKVNKTDAKAYFKRPTLNMLVNQPFQVVDSEGKFDVMATVAGGGLSGQAGALKSGIAKALVAFNPDNKPALKKAGFMTRDSRVVERKKFGRKKARKSFQFSKR